MTFGLFNLIGGLGCLLDVLGVSSSLGGAVEQSRAASGEACLRPVGSGPALVKLRAETSWKQLVKPV